MGSETFYIPVFSVLPSWDQPEGSVWFSLILGPMAPFTAFYSFMYRVSRKKKILAVRLTQGAQGKQRKKGLYPGADREGLPGV